MSPVYFKKSPVALFCFNIPCRFGNSPMLPVEMIMSPGCFFFFLISNSLTSPVEFKKRLCRPVELKGQGSHQCLSLCV